VVLARNLKIAVKMNTLKNNLIVGGFLTKVNIERP
jgi:hypothetical protein